MGLQWSGRMEQKSGFDIVYWEAQGSDTKWSGKPSQLLGVVAFKMTAIRTFQEVGRAAKQ
jgi:hypothetical protein